MTGKVYLVGAGPGDPRLITLRGAELLAQADVVFYDGLVNPLLLTLTKARCERTARTRTDGAVIIPQESINDQLIAAARGGHRVVRLKGGDPYIFGRGSEEASALTNAGIPFEIVPGITAATAAGVYAGFSFTHRHHASAVAFVTGQEAGDRNSSHLDYSALARFPGTLVFYMGLARLKMICDRLMEFGKSPSTPSAVVSHASLPDQQVVASDLSRLAETVAQCRLSAPSLIVVGECVGQRDAPSWFEILPLFGLRIGITRPEHQAAEVSQAVVRAGGQPVLLPMVRIRPPDDDQFQVLNTAIDELAEYDWLILTSANAVRGFMERLWSRGLDTRHLQQIRIAAMGSSTAAELQRWSLRADVIPEHSRSEALADALKASVAGKRCLWPAADRTRETLSQLLVSAGAGLQTVVAYRHVDVDDSDELRERFSKPPLDWIGVSSPAIARQAARLFPQLRDGSCLTRVVSISQLTTDAANDAGLSVHAQAAAASWTDMLHAVAVAEGRDHHEICDVWRPGDQ